MKKEENFKQQVDAWIKSFKKDIDCFAGELDDYSHALRLNAEETQFNYENICRLENKLDRIEIMMEKLVAVVEDKNSSLMPLKEKA